MVMPLLLRGRRNEVVWSGIKNPLFPHTPAACRCRTHPGNKDDLATQMLCLTHIEDNVLRLNGNCR